MTAPLALVARPRLPRGVRLRRDDVRGGWMLLAPERAFRVDEIAAAVGELCDGERDVRAIAATLAERYGAPAPEVEADVAAMLGDLAAKRVLET
jgi:pyrroloquinoline quinone biosynthesis protein D